MTKVIIAVGDADAIYSEKSIWGLPQRLVERGIEVTALTTDEVSVDDVKKAPFKIEKIEFPHHYVKIEDRVSNTSDMILEAQGIMLPGSDLPLWKILAMDDFVGSIMLLKEVFQDQKLDVDAVITPLMGVDNNSRESCALYIWILSLAKKQGIPTIGVEVSPIGNKNNMSIFPYDRYLVKTQWAKDCLIRQGLTRAEQVSVLRWEETYFLWPGKDSYVDAYLQSERQMREMLKVPYGSFSVFVPHHVSFLWEVKHILQALAELPRPFTVVSRIDTRTIRRQHGENEIFIKTYKAEIEKLPHVVLVDERVGIGLLSQLADVIIAPFASVITERTAMCQKPTIICQAGGEEGEQSKWCIWEPDPGKIPAIIRMWREEGVFARTTLADTILELVAPVEEKANGQFQEETVQAANPVLTESPMTSPPARGEGF